MTDETFSLYLQFDSDDPEFTRGWEGGKLFERMHWDPEPIDQTIHNTNTEMVMRMCEKLGREFRATELDDTWTEVHIGPGEVKRGELL